MAIQFTVDRITWERVHLTIDFVLSGTVDSDMLNFDGTAPELKGVFLKDTVRKLPVEWSLVDDGRVRAHINVSTFNGRSFLPSGTWKFFADYGTFTRGATWNMDRLDDLEAFTRVFLFAKNRAAFTVVFGITDSEEDPLFAMRAHHFVRRSAKKRTSRKPKAIYRRWKAKLTGSGARRKWANRIYKATVAAKKRRHEKLLSKGKQRLPRILFASEMRNGIEGNLLAVRDRMVERGLDKQYKFDYSFRTPAIATPQGFVTLIRKLAMADYVLIDDYMAVLEFLSLDKQTRIIQLWHAGSGFKNVGYARFGKFGSPALKNAHRKYTYAIAGSTHLQKVYAEVFGIEERAVVPTGLPRIDSFLDPEWQARSLDLVEQEFPLIKGKRRILFAPTFRGSNVRNAHYHYDKIDFDALYEACGDDHVVMFRMHHFVPGQVPIPPRYSDRLIDVASFRDVNQLLIATDILVTDYSSIIYEFSLLRRPMLFFAYDKVVYSGVRGFHRPYDETAPGKVVATFDELLDAIRDEDFEIHKVDSFLAENFDQIDAHASDRVIDWLILGDPPSATTNAAEPPTDELVADAIDEPATAEELPLSAETSLSAVTPAEDDLGLPEELVLTMEAGLADNRTLTDELAEGIEDGLDNGTPQKQPGMQGDPA